MQTGVLPALHVVWGGMRVTVSLHALAIVVAVAAGAAIAVRRAREVPPVLAAVSVTAVAALAGSRLLFQTLHGGAAGFWSGGMSSMGGVTAGLVTVCATAWLTRRPPAELLDAVAPAGVLALGIGRVGCFLAGCCYGRSTSLPWGVVFPELGPPARHPLQLYSALGDVGLVLLLPGKDAPPGTVTRWTLVGFGLLRAGLETLRDPAAADRLPGGVTLAQAAALLLAVAALVGPWVASSLRPRKPSRYGSVAKESSTWPMRNR